MKTIPEVLDEILTPKLDFIFRVNPLIIGLKDWICFIFGHDWTFLSDMYGNFRGREVCLRCNLEEKTGERHHNWEMDYGKYARCHKH